MSDFLGETLVYLTPHWAFQLVNDSLSFSRADSFCRGRFSSLITSDQKEVLELLRQAGLHSSVWVRDSSRVASKPVALSQQCEWKCSFKLQIFVLFCFTWNTFLVSSFRFAVLSSKVSKGVAWRLCTRQQVLPSPLICQCLCSSSVGPMVEWGVDHIFLRCTCLYQWVPAARPSRHAGSHFAGAHHPWEAPTIQGILPKWWCVASNLCHMAAEWWPLGYLCGRRQERHRLRHRHFQGYLRWWDSDPGAGPRLFWREFYRAFLWKYNWPKCLEHVFGITPCPSAKWMFTGHPGPAFQLEPWAP